MADVSTKPYLIRAIHEWCSDSGLTPYIAVLADSGLVPPLRLVAPVGEPGPTAPEAGRRSASA